jgi:acetyl esterase/lipase
VYFHGGAYIREIQSFMWDLAARIVQHSQCEMVIPIYPLAPLATAEHTVAHSAELVADLIHLHGTRNVILMGDSAGGGLALAVAQHLQVVSKKQQPSNLPQPAHLILISPWIDVTMTDPRQALIEPTDPMLGRAGLAECGRLYAGTLDVNDYRVSPIHGSFKDLPPMTVFTSNRDILWTDSMALVSRARESGVEVELDDRPGLLHDWVLFPTSEAAQAVKRITQLCNSNV